MRLPARTSCARRRGARGQRLYCFVSSISVYADFTQANDEESPLAELGDLPADEVTNESYGPLKALCEDAVRDVFGRARSSCGRASSSGRTTRPAASRTGRTASRAAARCSRPAPPERPTQVIDVRDLGEWIVALCGAAHERHVQRDAPGVAWSELLDTCRRVAASDAEITWVERRRSCVEHEVGEWMELPLWIADPSHGGSADRRGREPRARGRL